MRGFLSRVFDSRPTSAPPEEQSLEAVLYDGDEPLEVVGESHYQEELWAIVGRGGGKSREVARLACYLACGRSYRRVPGEHLYVGVAAPDKKQARLTFRYIVGLLRSV